MKKNILLLLIMILGHSLFAQNHKAITGKWVNSSGETHIQIYEKSGKYFGKLNWIKEPNSVHGIPKVDGKNPDHALRSRPLLGLELLQGFVHTGDQVYEDGTIYDPKSGKTYSCKMTIIGKILKIRGFIGFYLLGRTEILHRLE